ncbi:MAG: hypothetical protein HYW22_02070 [Candidatus Aenigmarchaeota archaeon]|nr:hypothetical protein [Candidatus Aenigmarchaeota archaeon]
MIPDSDIVGLLCPGCDMVVAQNEIIERNGRIGCIKCWKISWIEVSKS